MTGPRPVQPPVVVGQGVVERRRELLAALDTARSREVEATDLADRFISVPLSLLGWVGAVRGEYRWVCQVADPDTLRTCNQVGRADSYPQAVDGLTDHICQEHGGLPE
jgi:hypothetical protein